MAQPAHHAEDSDEELTDEQVRQLLNEAEKRLREKASSHPTAEKPFTLPKLKPTQLPDTYLTTKGSITRLDQSKLVPEKDRALANGVKKIEDPVVAKRQRKEVRTHILLSMSIMEALVNFLSKDKGLIGSLGHISLVLKEDCSICLSTPCR